MESGGSKPAEMKKLPLPSEMKAILEKIFSAHEIYGVDICGDSGEMAENGAPINNQTNATLFDFLSQKK
jgi:hypothetical protein